MQLLTAREVAERFGLSASSLSQRTYRLRNGIPFLAVGRAIRFREQELLEWLDGRKGLKAREANPLPVADAEGQDSALRADSRFVAPKSALRASSAISASKSGIKMKIPIR
jgi:excisionase family DNA binding protein